MKMLQPCRGFRRVVGICSLLAMVALAAVRGQAADRSMYNREMLDYWSDGYIRSTAWILQREVMRAISDEEKSHLPAINLAFPIGDLDAFSSVNNDKTTTINLPVSSLKFFDDLSVAFAWYSTNNYSLEPIFIYLNAIGIVSRHDDPRFAPFSALKVSADAMDDPRVVALSKEVFRSTVSWILSYHVGHAYLQHGRGPYSPEVSRKNAIAADQFAFEIARRLRLIPYGIILYYQVVAAFTPKPSDFDSPESYQAWLAVNILPPPEDRLLALSEALHQHARDFAIGTSDAVNVEKAVLHIADLVVQIAKLTNQHTSMAQPPAAPSANQSQQELELDKLRREREIAKGQHRMEVLDQIIKGIEPRKLEDLDSDWSLKMEAEPPTAPGTATARLALLVPKALIYGEDHIVRVILGPSDAVMAIEKNAGDESIAYDDQVRVSLRMESKLVASDMDLVPVTPERQIVNSSQLTEWKWRVRPSGSGPLRLYLSFQEVSTVEADSLPRVIRLTEAVIMVERTIWARLWEFVAANWQWLWAAIAVPIASFLWTKRRRFLH